MERCKKCKVPLTGFLSKISRLIGVKPSEKYPGICNKCESKVQPGKYVCQICSREIDESVALTHVKAEEYLLELIRRDHPEWKVDKNTCQQCIDYYRVLVKKAEI
ncbi:MAG: hypothetical protein ISS45_08315 [Candidatus Omnitrophica bacterium]|nr:hypothetical protein [Candidatus Omnitrophota bacterium]